jgi:hypothetical protein
VEGRFFELVAVIVGEACSALSGGDGGELREDCWSIVSGGECRGINVAGEHECGDEGLVPIQSVVELTKECGDEGVVPW